MSTMPDLDRLKSQLLTSGLQQKDFPLYQVIDQLIQALRQTIDTVDDALGLSDSGGGTSLGQSFGTVKNEKASLPNSRQLTAGTGIEFNDTFNRLVINSAMPPGSMGDGSEPGEEGPMGPQGPRGATGPTGPSGSGSAMPYWFYEEPEILESPYPLATSVALINAPNNFSVDQYISKTTPIVVWNDTSQGLNLKKFRILNFAQFLAFQVLNDAESAVLGSMQMDRAGVLSVPAGLGATPLNATNITSGTLADARLSSNVPLKNVVNQFTVNQRIDNSGGDYPRVTLKHVGAPVDQKIWQILNSSADLVIWALNDAESVVLSAYTFGRTGIFSTGQITLSGSIRISGRSNVSLAADQTAWNPAGMGSVLHFIVVPTLAGWTIRGILAQSDGYILVLHNASGNVINITHEDGAAAGADRLSLTGSAGTIITNNQAFTFIYDGSVARWRQIAKS